MGQLTKLYGKLKESVESKKLPQDNTLYKTLKDLNDKGYLAANDDLTLKQFLREDVKDLNPYQKAQLKRDCEAIVGLDILKDEPDIKKSLESFSKGKGFFEKILDFFGKIFGLDLEVVSKETKTEKVPVNQEKNQDSNIQKDEPLQSQGLNGQTASKDQEKDNSKKNEPEKKEEKSAGIIASILKGVAKLLGFKLDAKPKEKFAKTQKMDLKGINPSVSTIELGSGRIMDNSIEHKSGIEQKLQQRMAAKQNENSSKQSSSHNASFDNKGFSPSASSASKNNSQKKTNEIG